MPGIVVFNRRWSVGSDDFVVAAVLLVILHLIWVVALSVILGVLDFGPDTWCSRKLWWLVISYVAILGTCLLLEALGAWVSMRGSILDTKPRASMQYILYIRLVVLFCELAWLILSIIWVAQQYSVCSDATPMKAVIGIIVCNWAVLLCVLISVCCTFDTAGRSWVKMKRYQASLKERETRAGQKRRSGSRRRNWRSSASDYFRRWSMRGQNIRMKAMRAYEQSWDRRCQILFCCVKEERNRNSFTEIAKLFTEFFRDLDVVPTDIVAGFVLLRQNQKLRRKFVVSQHTNDVYQFLSGVPITPSSRFLSLTNPDTMADYNKVLHYMKYALAAYGWPVYMMMRTGTGLCRIMPYLRCCCCCLGAGADKTQVDIVDDNCCECNFAAMQKLSGLERVDIIYATYHVDIGETPFFVAVDHDHKTVVISIRGTLSLQDVLTDLKADSEQLPVEPPREDWQAHKGMVQAAVYIKKKIKDEMLLSKAFGSDMDRVTQQYDLVLVGHSLGAGTAAILAILMYQEFPNLHCYSYSPPGGLLSAACCEDTKSFITSVVVGKDVVPRIGLNQLEALRNDLITVIKKSKSPKWKIISGSVMCCGCGEKSLEKHSSQMEMYELMKQEKVERAFYHPSDSQIALTSHTPLYPPGRIIHVVRNHPQDPVSLCGKKEPVYQAVWADNREFDEVLISPTMVADHMPDNVMHALEKVVTNVSPAKPNRRPPQTKKPEISLPIANTDPTNPEHIEPSSAVTLSNAPPPPSQTADLSLSWDYTDVTRRIMPGRSNLVAPLATLVAQSYPPHELSSDLLEQRPGTLGVPHEDWLGLAPLASPETLSESSSMDSVGSKRYSNGYQKLTNSIVRMSPIQQSPGINKADVYHQFQEALLAQDKLDKRMSAPCGSVATTSDLTTSIDSSEFRDSIPPHSLNQSTTSVPRESLPPVAQSTPIKPDLLNNNELSPLNSDTPPLNRSSSHSSAEWGVKTLPYDCNKTMEDMNLTEIGHRIADKITAIQSNDPYRLTYESFASDCSSFVPHSPDGVAGEEGPVLYHPVEGHYSPAGRGYPHGTYLPDSADDDATPNTSFTERTTPNGSISSDNDRDMETSQGKMTQMLTSTSSNKTKEEIEITTTNDMGSEGRDVSLDNAVPKICIDLCDENPNSDESQDDVMPYDAVKDMHENPARYEPSLDFNDPMQSSSSSDTDSEDSGHMTDIPIQILTNEAYL